jgi:uncharacterized protein (TIGR00299 family) protein
VKEKSKAVFDKLATAEAKVHGTSKESIHFHEVGAVDAIVDIVGSALALDFLKPDMITASSIQVGGGFVECAHGKLPVPAPATAELLNGVPIKSGLAQCELTTPTGAAIITSFTDNFTDSISFRSERIGYGAGSNILDFPNLLRVYLGDTADTAANPVQILLETNIDDMNPEYYSLAEEKLFEAGALDVYKTFIVMKKGRLAIKLSVLVSQEAEKKVTDAIFKHTTSIGLRRQAVHKIALDRQVETVNTEYGAVRIKCAYVDGQKANCKPEYSDCLELANKHNLPIATIYQAVLYCMRSEK